MRRVPLLPEPSVHSFTMYEPVRSSVAVVEQKCLVYYKMDDLVYTPPPPQQNSVPVKSKHNAIVLQEPKHKKTSSKQVQYSIPIFTNFDNVIKAKPSHTSLTKSEVEKASLVDAMYEANAGRTTITDYLDKNVPSYKLVEQVSENVMVVRNTTTGENKVVVKGIDPFSASDHVDLQTKLWRGEPTQTFQDATRVARAYDATEVIGHSRGGSTAIAVAQELGIKSTGFNSVITHQNVTNAHNAPETFKHTEFSNGADIIVNGINDLTNPHAHGKYPSNLEFKTFAGIKGENFIGQHDVSQWTAPKLNRNDAIDLPMEELAFKSRHAGDLVTAEMFAKGIRENKTYREILNENEGGFGIVDSEGRFTSRNFRGNNMSQIYQAVGGEHTPDEIDEMTAQGSQEPHEHTLTDNEVRGIKSGAGTDMIDHALDNLADTYERLPPVPSTTARTIGKGIYQGVADSMKSESILEGVGAGIVGDMVATGVDHQIGRLPGELGNLQHSAVSFGTAGAMLGGAEMGVYGAAAGLAGEAARYGTDELLKSLGAGQQVRGNVDAIMSGAVSGAVMGSVGGPVGAAIGAGVGAVVSEGAYLVTTYADKVENFFRNLF